MKNNLSRRDFLKLSGLAGSGLILGIYLEACASGTEVPEVTVLPTSTLPATSTPRKPFDWNPNAFVMLDQDGVMTFTASRSEMGQGVRTSLAMIAAEELDVAWSSVRIVQAIADQKYGDQVTGGSTTVSRLYEGMRIAGAMARQLLIMAAANVWDVEPDQCTTEAGNVIHPDGVQRLFYGDLVQAASALKRSGKLQFKESSQYKIVGTDIGHWDAPRIVTGKADYGLDVRLPDMVFAAIARCPVFGGSISSYDDADARAVTGVKDVIVLDDRVAVIAENSWAAIRGRDALDIVWDEGANATLDSPEMVTQAIGRITPPTMDNLLEAYYELPYEAHVTMEPMNCTVYFHDGICEVWAPTQDPQYVRTEVAHACGLAGNKAIVHVTLMGGGFGRRLQVDYAVEAALLSKALSVPVQVIWTRADDLQHDFYHPMAVKYAFVSLDTPALPTIRTQRGSSSVPTGWWRSVEHFSTAFSEQSFIDEMAVALNRNPFDLRLELYEDNDDALEVINLAADKSNWGEAMPAGQGRGMAYFATFGVTHVAQVADVSVDTNGNVHVNRVVCAVNCGLAINPDTVKAQIEGGIVFGLTAALKSGIIIENGRVQHSNFHDYPILRMDEMPVIEVHIIPSEKKPTGIGEMGVPPIAPAVANAVYAATGKRVRHLPIVPEDLTA